MRNLCNKLRTRDEKGVMLSERGKEYLKRPSGVIEQFLSTIREEYDSLQLDIVRVKAFTYMSRVSLNFERVSTLSQWDQCFSSSSVGEKNYSLLKTKEEDRCYNLATRSLWPPLDIGASQTQTDFPRNIGMYWTTCEKKYFPNTKEVSAPIASQNLLISYMLLITRS